MSLEAAIAILVSLAGLALFAWVIRNEVRRTKATDDGTTWAQAGVRVDTHTRMIHFRHLSLPAGRILSVTTGRTKAQGSGTFPAAVITTDDPALTDIRVAFALKGAAQTFAWGLRDALTRAGNTNPEATNKPFTLGRKG